MVAIDGLDVPVGPGSTLANIAFVNAIKVADGRAPRRARRDAAGDHERGASSGAERARELFDGAYDEHARRLAKALRTS